MGWFKVDEQFFVHRKVVDLSKDAKLLYLVAIAYSSEQLTDGLLSPAALRIVAATVDVSASATATALVAAGLWEQTEQGYQIHDYLDHQAPAATRVKQRDDARDRMRRLRSDEQPTNGTVCSQDVRANNFRTSDEVQRLEKEIERDVEEDVAGESEGGTERAPDGAVPDPVDWVFDYYREYIQPDARVCPREKIRTRLQRFTVDDLTLGIEHFAADRWWMDHNGTRGAAWFFHSDARSEQFLTMVPRSTPDDNAPRRLHG